MVLWNIVPGYGMRFEPNWDWEWPKVGKLTIDNCMVREETVTDMGFKQLVSQFGANPKMVPS